MDCNTFAMKGKQNDFKCSDDNPLDATPNGCNLPRGCNFFLQPNQAFYKMNCNFLPKGLTQWLQLFS